MELESVCTAEAPALQVSWAAPVLHILHRLAGSFSLKVKVEISRRSRRFDGF